MRECRQGSPLSPLLSNIVLDELDRDLARRGHRFVRYADDCNVYVRSERAGLRVMASLERLIGRRLRLKINREKSAVARPENRHFLGFCLRRDPQSGAVVVLLSERTKRNAMARIRELTPRQWGGTLDSCIARLNAWLRGWHEFFGIAAASEEYVLRALDAHIRRRLRAIAIVLKHWRRQRTVVRNLIGLGVPPRSAWRGVYGGRKSTWALSHSPAVDKAMPVAFGRREPVGVMLERERRLLSDLPAEPHCVAEEASPRVDSKAMITVRRNRYSVPARLVGMRVRVQVGAREIAVWHDGKVVATHERLAGCHGTSAQLDHYLDLLSRKPGVLARSLALRQQRDRGDWPPCFDQLWSEIEGKAGRSEAARQMVEVLLLNREVGPRRVELAVRSALAAGAHDERAVALLARRVERPSAPALALEERLVGIGSPPPSDLSGYDRLREAV